MKNISKILNKKKTNERKLINYHNKLHFDDLLPRENQYGDIGESELESICSSFVSALEEAKKKKKKTKKNFVDLSCFILDLYRNQVLMYDFITEIILNQDNFKISNKLNENLVNNKILLDNQNRYLANLNSIFSSLEDSEKSDNVLDNIVKNTHTFLHLYGNVKNINGLLNVYNGHQLMIYKNISELEPKIRDINSKLLLDENPVLGDFKSKYRYVFNLILNCYDLNVNETKFNEVINKQYDDLKAKNKKNNFVEDIFKQDNLDNILSYRSFERLFLYKKRMFQKIFNKHFEKHTIDLFAKDINVNDVINENFNKALAEYK